MIGGFLGTGKTTAVGRLARQFTDSGLRVGLITNDQGCELVDTLTLCACSAWKKTAVSPRRSPTSTRSRSRRPTRSSSTRAISLTRRGWRRCARRSPQSSRRRRPSPRGGVARRARRDRQGIGACHAGGVSGIAGKAGSSGAFPSRLAGPDSSRQGSRVVNGISGSSRFLAGGRVRKFRTSIFKLQSKG